MGVGPDGIFCFQGIHSKTPVGPSMDISPGGLGLGLGLLMSGWRTAGGGANRRRGSWRNSAAQYWRRSGLLVNQTGNKFPKQKNVEIDR